MHRPHGLDCGESRSDTGLTVKHQVAATDSYRRGEAHVEREPISGASKRTAASASDEPGRPVEVRRASWRERVRSKPGLAPAYRVGVFVTGLFFIVFGFALAVLPGPLTIPPVLFGLWIWSTEFSFAKRFFGSFKRKAREAWQHARVHRTSSAAITVGGLAAAGAVAWAISYFQLIAKGQEAIGL